MIDITLDTTRTPAQLRLAGELTIASAEQARLALLQALAPADGAPRSPLWLDASGITAADSAGVQLLLATARHLNAAQSPYAAALSGCAPTLQRVAQALGAASSTHCCGLLRAPTAGMTAGGAA